MSLNLLTILTGQGHVSEVSVIFEVSEGTTFLVSSASSLVYSCVILVQADLETLRHSTIQTSRSYILKDKKFAESAFQSQKICGKNA